MLIHVDIYYNGRNNKTKNIKGGANNGKTKFKNKYTVFSRAII